MANLTELIPAGGFPDDETALDAFMDWVLDKGIEPYPAQEEAFLELFNDSHVVLKTPTGSGKSLVALALHFRELAAGRRSVYTSPIKALVSEKFVSLCESFGAEQVGMMTGDGTVNRDAKIICCTAEVLSKLALRYGEETPFSGVVMDEFHYYGDRDRGMAWQIPLLTMPHGRFLLMSATLGTTTAIEEDLAARTGREVVVVASNDRPVPLEFVYSDHPLTNKLVHLARTRFAPVYAVFFTQRDATEQAQSLMSTNLCSAEEKAELKAAVKGFRFDSPFGPTLRRFILHGVAVHHAGLLPKYRFLVEKLSQRALFKVVCGTDTLGVGINVPIRTVHFTQLCKFDGEEVRILSNRHFKQIAGRAGRKGFDEEGTVVAQAPAWIIDNARLAAAVDEGKKKKKKQKKGPPTRGYKHWDEETFKQLISRPPEELESRFVVDHSLVLMLLQKADETLGDGIAELDDLIDRSHASVRDKVSLKQQARERLQELIDAGVVVDNGPDSVPSHTVSVELQSEFSLHHSLSLFLLHVLPMLDQEKPDYALDVITMVEAILEHPRVVLSAQTSRAKGQLIAELKADGVPYEERMEALEDVSWPKVHAEWTYATFNAWKEDRPWVQGDPIRPKNVVRELVEGQMVFSGYVRELKMERAEGVLLRYIGQVYKALLQNVPEAFRDDRVVDVIAFLRALLARVDDSMVKTWESMLSGADPTAEDKPVDISADLKPFRARIRAELYAVVRALSLQDWDEAAATTRQSDESWTAADIETAITPYIEERGGVIFDGRLRQGWTTVIEQTEPHLWAVKQILVDEEEEDSAWSVDGIVDLREDTNPMGPIVRLQAIGD